MILGDLVPGRRTAHDLAAIVALSGGLLVLAYLWTSQPDVGVVVSSNITTFDQEYWIAKHIAGEGPVDRRRKGFTVDVDILLKNRKSEATGITVDYGIVNRSSGEKISGGEKWLRLEAKETRNVDIIFDLDTLLIPYASSDPEDYSCRIGVSGMTPSGDGWRREFFPPLPGVGKYRT